MIKSAFLLAACATSLVAVPITIDTGNPGNAGTDNVLFNDGSLIHSGNLVQGNFSGANSGYIVEFTSSSGNNQLIGNGGQANVTGFTTGNTPLANLEFGLDDDATFTTAIFNVISANTRTDGGNVDIDFIVTYLGATGSPFTTTETLSWNGNNFYSIVAADGALITSISISTDLGDIAEVKQIRLGGFAPGPSVNVPDGGSTVALMGVAMAGMAMIRRRK